MSTHYSHTNLPSKRDTYQDFTDLISIFWEFHKARVESGNIPPILLDGCSDIPFNAQAEFEVGTINIPKSFEYSLSWTLENSWDLFLKMNGINFGEAVAPSDIDDAIRAARLPKELSIFRNDLVLDLAKSAERNFSAIRNEAQSTLLTYNHTDNVIKQGIRTGAEFGVLLKGLFGDEFRPVLTKRIAKTSLDKIDETSRQLSTDSSGFPHQKDHERYQLLDNSRVGLNLEMLRSLGLGKAIGCPSSNMPSEKTQTFLRESIPGYKPRPMLEDFSKYLDEVYEANVGEWFRSLSDHRKEMLDQNVRALLDGTSRREAIKRNTAPEGCPRKESF